MGYTSILVGTDGSARANRAVRHAAGLATAYSCRLTIAVAYQPNRPEDVARAQEGVPADLRYLLTDSSQADELAAQAKVVAREAGVNDVVCRVAAGDPADVLLSVADDMDSDLIVVGNKGMTGTARFFLGSVPNRISHHAPCDLVIVNTDEE